MQNIRERHIIVDIAFIIGGAIVGAGFDVLLSHPERWIVGIGALVFGGVFLGIAVYFDRRNIHDEEAEVKEAEHIIHPEWETES